MYKNDYRYKYVLTLAFGASVYSIEGFSTMINRDCMAKESIDSLKYVILRENGR